MNYNRIRNDVIKYILNTFLELIKIKKDIQITEYEKSILQKELDCVIGSIQNINNEYSYEIKRPIVALKRLDMYKITYKNEEIFLSEYFKLYFNEIIILLNQELNEKMKSKAKNKK